MEKRTYVIDENGVVIELELTQKRPHVWLISFKRVALNGVDLTAQCRKIELFVHACRFFFKMQGSLFITGEQYFHEPEDLVKAFRRSLGKQTEGFVEVTLADGTKIFLQHGRLLFNSLF